MHGRSPALVAIAAAALLATAGCVGLSGAGPTPSAATTDAVTTTELPTVSVVDADTNETLGAVTVETAETRSERYTGLSAHESLGDDEGMLFVYGDERERDYVMRSMDFPIDIVFVGADGHITAVHHAQTEPDNRNLTRYSGPGKWVLEVPYEWTDEHGVTEGDRVVVPETNP